MPLIEPKKDQELSVIVREVDESTMINDSIVEIVSSMGKFSPFSDTAAADLTFISNSLSK